MYIIFAALIHSDITEKGFVEHVRDTDRGIDE